MYGVCRDRNAGCGVPFFSFFFLSLLTDAIRSVIKKAELSVNKAELSVKKAELSVKKAELSVKKRSRQLPSRLLRVNISRIYNTDI